MSARPQWSRKLSAVLGALLANAHRRGLVARNVVRELRSFDEQGVDNRADKRQKGKLRVGVDIPTRQEIKALVDSLHGRWRPMILTTIFTGLRAHPSFAACVGSMLISRRMNFMSGSV